MDSVEKMGTPQQEAIVRARQHILALQSPHGYWPALLELDIRQTGESVFFKYWLGKADEEDKQ